MSRLRIIIVRSMLALVLLGLTACIDTGHLYLASLDGARVRGLGFMAYGEPLGAVSDRGVYWHERGMDGEEAVVRRSKHHSTRVLVDPTRTLGRFAATERYLYWMRGRPETGYAVFRRLLDTGRDEKLTELGVGLLPSTFVGGPDHACWGEVRKGSVNGATDSRSLTFRCVADSDGFVRTVATPSSRIFSLSEPWCNLAIDHTSIYWSEDDALYRAPIGGGEPARIARGKHIRSLAIDGDHLLAWSTKT